MTAPTPADLPTYHHVERAAATLRGIAHRTPVLTSSTLNAWTGADLYFKAEPFQRGGAFKFRGAYHAIASLPAAARARGVVAYSSGNHAQAVALACRLLHIPSVIVMPTDSPAVKLAATRDYGAEVVLYDRRREDREAIGAHLATTRGLTLIPPYNHPDVIAGAGTAALELVDDVGSLDALVVPCGGGGLLSGSALVARHRLPGCQVVGVEPAAGDDATRSFSARTLLAVEQPPETIADGARTLSLGALTFALILAHVDAMVTVEDPALARATLHLLERMKVVVEPTGALGLAAVLERRLDVRGRRVGIILSGGNADLSHLSHWSALA